MNTHDIDQIIDRIESCAPMDVAGRNKHLHDLRSAIAPYQQRIAELESQLEAVGAGGVSSQRITSPSRGEPYNPRKPTEEEWRRLTENGRKAWGGKDTEPVRVPGNDERAAQGLPPYSPRHLTEEEWNRLAENGRRAWGNHPDGPAEVPSVPPTKRSFTVEPHGNGYAIYQGRDNFHHGLNLAILTECTPEFAKRIEFALNESAEPTNKHSLSVAEPEKEPPCET